MRKLLLTIALYVLATLPSLAQHQEGNPFKRLGYKPSVYTFGDDKEFHDLDTVVEIGDVLFNTQTKEVVGFVEDMDSLIELKPELQSMSIDPHCEKYYSITPYAYCFNNPVRFIDPDGRDVWVKKGEDGTYEIVGGTANTDLNIYTVDSEGNRTDNIVGQTMTQYSFFYDDGSIVEGAIINPNDQSGQNFINNEIIKENPGLISYMANATGGEKYDFKTIGIENVPEDSKSQLQYKYRGMPLVDENGNTVYASARDVGNYGAGYVAGKKGLDWKTARAGFDLLESVQNNRRTAEQMPTQKAQRLGYNAGSKQYPLRKANNWIKGLFNMPTSRPK